MPRSYILELQTFQSILIGTTVNLGLLTSPPGGSNPGTEVSGPGYARAAMTLSQVGVLCAINQYPVVFSATGTLAAGAVFRCLRHDRRSPVLGCARRAGIDERWDGHHRSRCDLHRLDRAV